MSSWLKREPSPQSLSLLDMFHNKDLVGALLKTKDGRFLALNVFQYFPSFILGGDVKTQTWRSGEVELTFSGIYYISGNIITLLKSQDNFVSCLFFLLFFACLLESGSNEAQAGFRVTSVAESDLALLTFLLLSPSAAITDTHPQVWPHSSF